ncbi:MAG: hypothetical protein ACYSUI_03710 [Planctomycetota bacterium]|jgi:hypothetical protein
MANMLSAQFASHLSGIIYAAYDHKCRGDAAYWQAAIRQAAELAKSLDDEFLGWVCQQTGVPVSDLKHLIESIRRGAHVIPLKRLDEPKYLPVKICLQEVANQIQQEWFQQQQERNFQPTPWEYVVQTLLSRMSIPCDEQRLAVYAEQLSCGNLSQNDELTIEIARLHREGGADELTAKLRRHYPDEAEQMGLQALATVPTVRTTISADEANQKAREILKHDPNITRDCLAAKIGCATGTVSSLGAWKAVQERRKEEREENRKARPPQAVSLTPKLQSVVGEDDDALKKLVQDQHADSEPSPLAEDHPGKAPLKVRTRRRP